mmetsp:Transcript_12937/g.19462  ORF Transcript_12937/g.19462 Transcript_12937/m.19462 type:complete len:357 (+) Transcript_12937:40-1110(+)
MNKKQKVDNVKVSFLGSDYSFTCVAAKNFFSKISSAIHYEASPTCVSIFDDVCSGRIDYGVVPMESSNHGSMHVVFDQLLKHCEGVTIIGEVVEREQHCLCTKATTSDVSIARIMSHPVIIEDCSEFLDALDRKRSRLSLERIERDSTCDSAAACKLLLSTADGSGDAVICTRQAAAFYGLNVISESIGNDRNSETRYAIIAKASRSTGISPTLEVIDPLYIGPESTTARQDDVKKATVVLSVKNTPGSMFRMISCFALRDINILKIESRPASTACRLAIPGLSAAGGSAFAHWDLLFFVDFTPSEREIVNEALQRNLEECCTWTRSLGRYTQHGNSHTVTEPSDWSNMIDILATA